VGRGCRSSCWGQHALRRTEKLLKQHAALDLKFLSVNIWKQHAAEFLLPPTNISSGWRRETNCADCGQTSRQRATMKSDSFRVCWYEIVTVVGLLTRKESRVVIASHSLAESHLQVVPAGSLPGQERREASADHRELERGQTGLRRHAGLPDLRAYFGCHWVLPKGNLTGHTWSPGRLC